MEDLTLELGMVKVLYTERLTPRMEHVVTHCTTQLLCAIVMDNDVRAMFAPLWVTDNAGRFGGLR